MDSSTVSSNTCVVTLVKRNSLSSVKLGSCSGVFINHKLRIVIAHASLLAELNSKDYEQLRRDLTANKLTNLLPNHSAEVVFDARRYQVQNSSNQHYDLSSNNHQNIAREKEMYTIIPAAIELIFKCESFHQTSEQFLAKSQGWFFLPRKHFFLPYFILIKLQNYDGLLPIEPLLVKSSVECNPGDTVEVFGTPYGNLCVEVFLNSVSRGVISNYFGPNKVQILTDARCIPGTEGGLVCTLDNNNLKRAIGIVVSPFCWKNQNWIGLTLVCSLEEILNSIALALIVSEPGENPKELLKPFSASPLNTNSSVSGVSKHPASSPYNFTLSENIKQYLCHVIGQKGTGTGILISHDTILTCSHVVCDNSEVSIKLNGDKHWHQATLVYSTPLTEPFDVAVLKLNNYSFLTPTKLLSFPEITTAVEGMPVYAVGFALFTSHSNPQPTVTSGVVARLVQHKQTDILIQTTCAVYPGSSGGAVMSKSGNIVGMACSTVKMMINQAHVSLVIPMTTLKVITEPYLQDNDAEYLKQLWLKSGKERQIWKLQSTFDCSRNLLSKL
ncbi:peroxisomal leader peptide-processing protease isoform X2 [Octopus bimaculoides]|uniref:peroxisomal leader peptide-processing protease isoform X2 n=1 Tax=Octopus bimaculoides TaxID=37653 RepID=UPI00071D46B9|nr:peroxisomal leader peptide-processing protease isoform X2 [Octopus bimaculoides]|eukprot:XP_014788700.1 PREDICTED: peroxisomal leader peptide-processing protease-like isoform X2 [Octopus bimaculoides]